MIRRLVAWLFPDQPVGLGARGTRFWPPPDLPDGYTPPSAAVGAQPRPLLSPAELDVVGLLCQAHNAFAALPEHHPCDMDEWVASVHQLQRQVMARAARRAYPNVFRPMVGQQAKPEKDYRR